MSDDFDTLLAEVRQCRLCRDAPRHTPRLPHEPRPVLRGRPSARVCIVGQAPGTRVHASGLPFDDPSGTRLREWMGIAPELFYDEQRVAVVPMGFCFPGQNDKGADLPPRRECAPRWRQAVLDALGGFELTLVIGQYAQSWHLGSRRKGTLGETVKAWREYYDPAAPRRLLPLPHPSWRNNAWLRDNPWFEAEVVPVLRAEVAALVKDR